TPALKPDSKPGPDVFGQQPATVPSESAPVELPATNARQDTPTPWRAHRSTAPVAQTNISAPPAALAVRSRPSLAQITSDVSTGAQRTVSDATAAIAATADALTTAVTNASTSAASQGVNFSGVPLADTTELTTQPAASASAPVDPVTQVVSRPLARIVAGVLSVFGTGPMATNTPVAPAEPPALWGLLAWVRREIGHIAAPGFNATTPTQATQTAELSQSVATLAVSPLGTPEQLAAEKIATRTVNTLPVMLMKLVLRHSFLSTARQQFALVGGPDAENVAALNNAVDEYAMAAAFQQQLLNPMAPTVVTQVAPPHIWYGMDVNGSRILYDNPDTIYRFMSVNASSSYVITGQFHNYPDGFPADISFSVLEGLAGTTSSILTKDDLEVNPDGTFRITVSSKPAAPGEKNHLQLTSSSTIIAGRDTLADWNVEEPMSLSIERVSGPPNSLFAQLGGFTLLGPLVTDSPLLTTVVSLIPPLPYVPPVLRGTFTALILVVRGASEEAKYMGLATTNPGTGELRQPNVVSQPASNAEFLANQLQSNSYFQLADTEALVLTIDPGNAAYFIVPVYNDWTITDNYWDQQTSLNTAQAIPNVDGTYTVVISPTDPGVANWISTGGLNQGTISIRFQDLDPNIADPPRIVDQQVVLLAEVESFFPDDPRYFVTEQQRADQLALRKAGFDNRWAPYPQP
ncbi:MAG: DUF1214 domain-containing protein, partial [Mycobacterium sp.]